MEYCETYKEIKKNKSMGLRGYMRSFALDGLSIFDWINGIQNDLNKNRVQFLYIHHVFKDEERKFDYLLRRLALNHTFISYSDAVNKILFKTIDEPYIIVTSDDGFKNNLRAAEILNENGARGCFFINPDIIGDSNYENIKTFCKVRLKLPPIEFLNWKDVEKLLKMGHEIGSHTMGHINIADTPAEKILEDCSKSFELLKSRCGDVKHFAYPKGRFFYFNEIGRKAVFESGFISCASGERGCHVNPDKDIKKEELCILRDHVILDWNISHILYFLANNSRKASPQNNYFPYK